MGGIIKKIAKTYTTTQYTKLSVGYDIIISPDLTTALRNSTIVQSSITHSGFVPSKKKCIWLPQATTKFLGLIIDLSAHSFSTPIQARSLATVTGTLVSMSLALGPVTRLMTRNMYRAIEQRHTWSDSIFVSDSTITELKFWLSNLDFLNGFSINTSIPHPAPFIQTPAEQATADT